MESIQKIAEKPLIEWGGQIVITTAQLADAYGASADNINDNFSRNKDRFEAGKHYIYLTGEELKRFKNHPVFGGEVAKNSSRLYLWTRRGASRHCKILGTDKAWEQFDYLEDNYFDRETKRDMPQTTMELLELHYKALKEVNEKAEKTEEQVNTLEQRFNEFQDNMPVTGADMDDIQSAVKKKGVEMMGGKESNAYKDQSTRTYVYADIQCKLRRQFGVKRYKEIKHKNTQDALKIIMGTSCLLRLKTAWTW